MLTLYIHDEQLAQQLQQLAAHENRPVEDILKTLLAGYPVAVALPTEVPEPTQALQRIRHNAYAKARRYWESVADTAKALMSDAELDDQFGAFDEEGIPRLKSELKAEPPVGSLAYAAKVIREIGGIHTDGTLDVTRADEILNDEFADYLLGRDGDASK